MVGECSLQGDCIGAAGAVQRIVGGIAGDLVVEGIADAADRGIPHQDEVLDIAVEHIAGQRGANRIDTAGIGDGVAGIIDGIDVVPSAAIHRVRAGTAIDHVGVVVAGEAVVMGAADEIFDADQPVPSGAGRVLLLEARPRRRGRERDGDGSSSRRVGGGVIAGAAIDAIVSGAGFDAVVSLLAVEVVVSDAAEQHVAAEAAPELVIAVTTLKTVGNAIAE